MSAKRIPGQDARFGTLYVNASDYDQLSAENKRLRDLLMRVQVSLSLDDTEWGYSAAEKYKLLADIRAELSSGKAVGDAER